MFKTYLSSWFYFFITLSATAQPLPRFDLITLEEGISNGFVTAMYQEPNGMLWLATANQLNRYDGYHFTSYDRQDGASYPVAWALTGDRQGGIWVGTEDGLDHFDPATECFTNHRHDPKQPNSLSHNLILSVAVDTSGRVWAGTAQGINVKKKGQVGFTRYLYEPTAGRLPAAKALYCDRVGTMWVAVLDTLYQYQGNSIFAAIALPLTSNSQREINYIRAINEDNRGRLWIGTEGNGVHVYDKKSDCFVAHYHQQAGPAQALSHNTVTATLEVAPGVHWVATYGGGLNIINEKTSTVQQLHSRSSVELPVTVIRNLLRDEAGNIWLGTAYEGLYLVKKHSKQFRNYRPRDPALPWGKGCSWIERPDGRLWMGSFIGGLRLFDPANGQITAARYQWRGKTDQLDKGILHITADRRGNLWMLLGQEVIARFDGNQIESVIAPRSGINPGFKLLFLDQSDHLWIGALNGIWKFTTDRQEMIEYTLPARNLAYGDNRNVEYFREDSSGRLWIATHGGLYRYDRSRDSLLYYPCTNRLYSLFESRNNSFWVGTSQGLATFDPVTGAYSYLDHLDIAPGIIQNIVEDDSGYLWLNATNGLYRYHPERQEVIHYNREDGLINNQLLPGMLQTTTGEIYVSGISGFTRFHPDAIRENDYAPPVVLTGFQLFNRAVPVTGSLGDTMTWPSPLNASISYTRQVALAHWQNDIAFEFAALDFTAPENNQYSYQLLGYDRHWIYTTADRRFAHYTNLAPGRYLFQVKAANNDGKWNAEPATVELVILPPWWQTLPAYLLWIFLAVSILYGVYRFQLNRQLTLAENRRLMEMDELKTRLYTNVTHEFRTPLTIIIGMADQLNNQLSESARAGLELIRRNGRQLLKLVNQMLDLAKLESGLLTLDMQQGDIINYLQYLIESFHSYAESKQIRLHFWSKKPSFYMDYDAERLMYVIANLLSNAIKFTPAGKDVYMSVDTIAKPGTAPDSLRIQIRDKGIGIPEEKLPYIFDRFYQADASPTRSGEGTGIGLALTRELVSLMQGRIRAESEMGKGSVFTVWLPIRRQQSRRSERPERRPPAAAEPLLVAPVDNLQVKKSPATDRPLLLIVEDNPDLVRYLLQMLHLQYNLEVAYNGERGVQKAIDLIPDLIITDVMMPVKDGYALCQSIRQHELTCHIPIIMLTAKADDRSRLRGLSQGADAYLAKPFLQEELFVRVSALLAQRQKMHQHYLSQMGLAGQGRDNLFPRHDAALPVDDFLQRVNQHLQEHLNRPGFNVQELSQAVYLSPSNLYRKIKATTGLNPNQYMRAFRLAKAKKLLRQTDNTINHISHSTGFSDPRYFSRIFKKETGMTPTAYRQQWTQR